MDNFWDERFSADEYIYGKEPNEFFRQQIEKLAPGRLLLLAEGEGRNAVFAAKLGWLVDAIDISENAKLKALKLARENNVEINYQVADLQTFNIPAETYDAVGIFFLHVPDETAELITQNAVGSLKPGGKLITEVFEKDQITKTSGGPKDAELLYSLEDIVRYYKPLDFDLFSKETITLSEGRLHQGEAIVIQFIGIKQKP
jgi:SAM-dependent methyltransferase